MRSSIIPIEIIDLHGEGYHLKISLEINGIPSKLILDTGASMTVFDKESFEALHTQLDVRSSDQLSTGLGTNSMKSFRATIPEIRIGKLSIRDLETALLDLSHINSAYQKISHAPIIGVLGNDILLRYDAQIDYGKKTLTMFDGESAGLFQRLRNSGF